MARNTGTASALGWLLALSMLWGASYTFIRIGVQTIPPLTLIAARTLLAGGLLLGVMRWHRIAWPRDRVAWQRFAVQALLNSVLPFTLIAWAEQSTGAGLAAILNALSPVFAFLLTARVTRHEPVGRLRIVGIAAGLLGTCLIVGVEALGGIGRAVLAQLAIVAATVCYAGAAVYGRHFGDLDPVVPATGSLVCGSALLAPAALLVDRPWTLHPSTASVLALLALSTLSTALALVIYFRLVRAIGPLATTAQAYLRVPFGVALGVWLLDEHMTPTSWIGLVGVVGGVVAMTVPTHRIARVVAVTSNDTPRDRHR